MPSYPPIRNEYDELYHEVRIKLKGVKRRSVLELEQLADASTFTEWFAEVKSSRKKLDFENVSSANQNLH